MDEAPIFLKTMGRTGGTLFVTLLDAHPDVAMSYEIYQDRLLDEAGRPLTAVEALRLVEASRQRDEDRWVKAIGHVNLRTFVARARRGGLTVEEVVEALRAFIRDGGEFGTLRGRLDFIEGLMRLKRSKFDKTRWGAKVATVELEVLHERHPDALFFAMARDGRDVLASQLNVGNFRTDPERCAREWRDHLVSFRAFLARPGVRGMLVNYELLIAEPERVLREVCDLIGVDYSDRMIAYHQQEMTLFHHPHGHLSHKQLQRGLNAESIGRWRRDLDEEQVERFEAIAGDLMGELGYAPAASGKGGR